MARFVIANGGTVSNVVKKAGYLSVGLIFPSALTSTVASVHASFDEGGTFVPVYDSEGNPVTIAVGASRAVGMSAQDLDALAPFSWFLLVMGTTEAAERTIEVLLK